MTEQITDPVAEARQDVGLAIVGYANLCYEAHHHQGDAGYSTKMEKGRREAKAAADRYAALKALAALDEAVKFVPRTHWRQRYIQVLREALEKEAAGAH